MVIGDNMQVEDQPYIRLACSVILQALLDHQENIREFGFQAAVELPAATYIRSTEYRPWSMAWLCDQIDIEQYKIVSRMNERGLLKDLRESVAAAKERRIRKKVEAA